MSLKLYAHPLSHNCRKIHWALVEMGVPHEYVTVDVLTGEQKKPEFLALNPNGRVPVVVDGDLTMFESNAILLHLAQREEKLLPQDRIGRAHVLEWLSWQASDLASQIQTPWLMKVYAQLGVQPLDEPKHAALVEAAAAPLRVLDRHLEGRSSIAGQSFTVADIAAAECVALSDEAGIPLAPYPSIRAWLEPLMAREAFQKTRPGS